MDPREMEMLIQRLVANPHDEEALAYAHRAGTVDPRSYAILLEKVGAGTSDPAYAAHWLSEAANVWSTTIGDAHHAARTLMGALEKDPTQRTAAERLAQLYREKGDLKALVALLERLVKSLMPLLNERPDVRLHIMAMHEELGRLWGESPFGRPERALENWRRLAELDPENVYAIYATRELLKTQQQYAEAIPYFAMEQSLVDDPERKYALYRDEADSRRLAGDMQGATQALRHARTYQPDDVALMQELGLVILERVSAGETVALPEREESAQLFVSLAEMYDGEYGLSYSVSALKAVPGNDRAMQLADYYAAQLNRIGEISPQYAAYLKVNPSGFMANEARAKAGSALPAQPSPSMPEAVAPASATRAPTFGPPPQEAGTPGEVGAGPAAPVARAAPAAIAAPVTAASAAPAAPAPADAPSGPAGILQQLLENGQAEAQKGRRPQALAKFREALKIEPANAEALSWVEEHLRQKRMYADLRDVLLAAARVPTVAPETRKAQLREVAGLCESQLRDLETAIQAWKQICQIDRTDEQARDQLRRLLERGARWDDLATVLEQEAMGTPDIEQKIALEKKLATLHEQKRKDPASAGEAWARIAALSPEDDPAIQTAVKLFEKAERFDLACQVITDNMASITEKSARGTLLHKLGDLRTKTGDAGAAGEAYTEAAKAVGQSKLWELAEKAHLAANRYADAAFALEHRAEIVGGKQQAVLLAQAADLRLKGGDAAAAIEKLEQAAEIDPANDTYAAALEEQYRSAQREADLVKYLLDRASRSNNDKARRIAARRSAAEIQQSLGDRAGARQSLLLLLSDGDDVDALSKLVEDAAERQDYQEAAELLRRLGAVTKNPADKLAITLREAAILAEKLDDVEGAIGRYEGICKTQNPNNRIALHAIADLEERRGNFKASANALEREILLADGVERVEIAQRLARLYEGPLANPRGAIKALDIIHEADPEDFDAMARLQKLCEEVEDWPRVAALMQTLIEVEGDDEESSRLTRCLVEILYAKLDKGDEALAALERLADTGDEPCRQAYIELGDKLGKKGIVASKLVAWNESAPGPQRIEALRSAFRRFVEIGREIDAVRVATDLARLRGLNHEVAERLEQIAVNVKDTAALSTAHDVLVRELSGPARAAELVRQAEVQASAGIDPLEALQHGEAGLPSVPPSEVEPFLARLGALTQDAGHVIDLYERQVSRCRNAADRLAALARAAQVAVDRGAIDRARSFFELAVGGGVVQEETISVLENTARRGGGRGGSNALLLILADTLAAGGQGSRDGGRTRSALLRRAATIAERDLNDVDKALGWLGEALITHVEDASLDALEQVGRNVDDPLRVDATLGHALEEVFDGPLVRKLLQRRARLRRDVIGDKKGAAADLKKLHDLSPADQEVMNDLSNLLLELGDHRGMIQLYEDQILRGRDPALRAELARKVARIWEEELGDAREAADAFRRVLRMKPGDPEATAGLERAKSNKLRRIPPPPSMGSGGASASSPAPPLDAPPPGAAGVPGSEPPPGSFKFSPQRSDASPDSNTGDDTVTTNDSPPISVTRNDLTVALESPGSFQDPASFEPTTARPPLAGRSYAAPNPQADAGYHEGVAQGKPPGYGNEQAGYGARGYEHQGYVRSDVDDEAGTAVVQPGYERAYDAHLTSYGHEQHGYGESYPQHYDPQVGYGYPQAFTHPAGYGEAQNPGGYGRPASYPPGAGASPAYGPRAAAAPIPPSGQPSDAEEIAEVEDVEFLDEETGKHDEP
jgi:tetratricopeptide (TPR) repeat protein